MGISNMMGPDFCESKCPICTNARKGNRFAGFLQRIEMVLMFGACPSGRARERAYGVKPNEPLPERKPNTGAEADT